MANKWIFSALHIVCFPAVHFLRGSPFCNALIAAAISSASSIESMPVVIVYFLCVCLIYIFGYLNLVVSFVRYHFELLLVP